MPAGEQVVERSPTPGEDRSAARPSCGSEANEDVPAIGRSGSVVSKPAALKPVERMEMRLMREAGATVKEVAGYFGVSVATAMRVLAHLREKLGPEKFKGKDARHHEQRARSHLYSAATSQNASRDAE